MARRPEITILGGGPAGLAMGYFARMAELPFTIFEAQDRVGGNCVTLQHGEFRFDSGAHRFHDKDPLVTAEIQSLVGDDLRKIEVPSQIWHEGRFVDFPLSPLNLWQSLGTVNFTRAGWSLLRGRLQRRRSSDSFLDFAISTYGRDIASRFLLGYSEKLWGAPCERLSPRICGARLKGLGLKSLLIEALLGGRAKTRHLDGAFYYPRRGYGTIVEKLAEACGNERIRLESRITRLFHAGDRLQWVEINGGERRPVDEVACTLPLGLTLRLLHPPPPEGVRDLARQLRYRNVLLVAVFLERERISSNGSIYFPDADFPFTRVYEPKNRSVEMSPPGHTSLVAEIPCQPGDAVWAAEPASLIELVAGRFERLRWLTRDEIVDATTVPMHHAYPILELGYESRLEQIAAYLSRFKNLRFAGRNGLFEYSHLHDMIRFGSEAVRDYLQPDSIERSAA